METEFKACSQCQFLDINRSCLKTEKINRDVVTGERYSTISSAYTARLHDHLCGMEARHFLRREPRVDEKLLNFFKKLFSRS